MFVCLQNSHHTVYVHFYPPTASALRSFASISRYLLPFAFSLLSAFSSLSPNFRLKRGRIHLTHLFRAYVIKTKIWTEKKNKQQKKKKTKQSITKATTAESHRGSERKREIRTFRGYKLLLGLLEQQQWKL